MDDKRLTYWSAGALGVFVFFILISILYAPSDTIINYPVPAAATSLPGTTELPSASLPAAAASAVPSPASVPLDGALLDARNATVNILCIADGSPFKPISGSGVIIDSRGVILTAAHIGQYFILRDYPKKDSISCTIRTGSPASYTFDAELIFLSSHWVTANQETLIETRPLGTGQSDFALLYITKSASGAALPSFPHVPLSSESIIDNTAVAIAAYGAEFLDGKTILDSLSMINDRGVVAKRYTFGTDTADLISVTGSRAAQVGSSGGSVVNAKGELVGLITTSSPEAELSNRSLRAITPLHIRERFETDLGQSLDVYLKSAPLPTLATSFKARAEELKEILIRATSN